VEVSIGLEAIRGMKLLEGSGHYLKGDYAERPLDFEAIRLIMRRFAEVGPPTHAMPRMPGG
jgi:hypothetical protein